MTEQGQYKCKDRGRQLICFDGCGIPGTYITPTDIDCIYEYHGITWILIEVKMNGVNVPIGQETAIRRFLEDMARAGKESVAIIAEHNEYDTSKDVMLKDCKIREVYFTNKENKVVHSPQVYKTIMEFVTSWIDYVERRTT